MDKQHILDEIRRTAKNGNALGTQAFSTETGIKEHVWRGKYWTKWTDALIEAGYRGNTWGTAHDESFLLKKILLLTRKLGKIPTYAEMQFERRVDPTFPSPRSIQEHIDGKADLVNRLLKYCQLHNDYHDIESILQSAQTPTSSQSRAASSPIGTKFKDGYVYLLKSGNKYKIGHSISLLPRAMALNRMTPEGAYLEHQIRTDDPPGIEKYWHNRFAEKRHHHEWFTLSSSDIAAFKRRKFM